jgi:hypothetical protein
MTTATLVSSFFISMRDWQISPSLVECVYLYQLRHKYLVRLPLPQGGETEGEKSDRGGEGRGEGGDGRGERGEGKGEMGEGRGERGEGKGEMGEGRGERGKRREGREERKGKGRGCKGEFMRAGDRMRVEFEA